MFVFSSFRAGLLPRSFYRRARRLQKMHVRPFHTPFRSIARTIRRPAQLRTPEGLPHRHFSCCSSLRKDPPSQDSSWDSDVETSSRELWESDASNLDGIEEAVDVTTAIESVDKVFHFVDIFKFFPSTVESMLDYIHVTSGMPWWVTIAACTMVARTSMLPLMFYMKRMAKRLRIIRPKVEEYKEQMSIFWHAGDTFRFMETRNKMNALMKAHNCSPWLTFVPMVGQGVLFASFFFALRTMTMADVPMASLTTEGALWFSNLALPDPYCILPALNCIFISTSLWLNVSDAGEMTEQMESLKPVLYIFNAVFFAVAIKFPCGVCVYMVTSSMYSLMYALLGKGWRKWKGTNADTAPVIAKKAGEIKRIVRDEEPKNKRDSKQGSKKAVKR